MAKWTINYFIYNCILFLASLFAIPYFIIRNIVLRRPVLAYFFNLSKTESEALKGQPVLWVQAVSVGETVTAESIIREFKKLQPDFKIVFTTTTPSGYQVAKQKLNELALVTFFPLEIPFLIKRFIAKIHPKLFIMVESELWPNAIRYSKEAGAKVALVNGRISDRSYQNYLKFSRFFAMVFQQIDLFAMQSVEDANRIGIIGAPLTRIMVTGNLKFDQEYPYFTDEQLTSFYRQYFFDKERLIFTAASTHRGEEEIVIQAYLNLVKTQPAYLILAPRHPSRTEEVGLLLQQYQLPYTKRSSAELGPECPVILFDTFGELGLAYAVADVIFVGGSLIKMKGIAGHNVLEAAAQEKPVIYGPFMDNFRESKRLLEEADAGFTVHDSAELTKVIQDITSDWALYQRRASNAKAAVLANRGAAKNTANFLNDILRSNS